MEKNKKIIIIVICLVLLIAGGCGLYFYLNREKNAKPSADALKFVQEYESYNGQKTSAGKDYLNLDLIEDNPIVYKSDAEIVDIMKKETALIYFGWPTCPWCRNTVGPLLEMAQENHVEKIYYVNILDIRDSYKVENKKAVVDQKGTDAYYEILKFLDQELSDFKVTDEKGKEYATGVKRLYAPTVVAVADGTLKDIHVGTVESQEDPYVPLTKTEQKELINIFKNMYQKIDNGVCSSEGC